MLRARQRRAETLGIAGRDPAMADLSSHVSPPIWARLAAKWKSARFYGVSEVEMPCTV